MLSFSSVFVGNKVPQLKIKWKSFSVAVLYGTILNFIRTWSTYKFAFQLVYSYFIFYFCLDHVLKFVFCSVVSLCTITEHTDSCSMKYAARSIQVVTFLQHPIRLLPYVMSI